MACKFQNSCRPEDPFLFKLTVIPSLRHSSKGKTEKPSTLQWKAEGEEGQKKRTKKPKSEDEYSFAQPWLTSSNWTKGKPVRWFCNLDENRSRHIAWSFLSRQDIKQKERQEKQSERRISQENISWSDIHKYKDTWRKSYNTLRILFSIIISFPLISKCHIM